MFIRMVPLINIILFVYISTFSTCVSQEVNTHSKGRLIFSLQNYSVGSAGLIVDKLYNLAMSSQNEILLQNIPPAVHFVLVQVHSYFYNVTMSYTKTLSPHLYVKGTNIGLVKLADSSGSDIQFFLTNPNMRNTTVVLAVQAYGKDAPIPGGCNMEFSVETAPYLHVRYDSNVVIVEGQFAASSLLLDTCEKQHIQYSMYRSFLPERDFTEETYFEMIRNMLTVDRIKSNSKKVGLAIEGPQLRRIYSAYSGTGSVYALIAISGSTASAYVPSLSYACDPAGWSDSCEVLTSAFSKVVCATMLFIGLFVSTFGHHSFKTTLFLMGFLAGSLVSYISVEYAEAFSNTVVLLLSAVSGLAFGIVWFSFWWWCGSPLFSILMALFISGFIIASVVFFAGLADYELFIVDENYWGIFVCLILGVSLVLLFWSHKGNMLACAVVGAYATIIPIDHYIGSNLKYIFVNIIRRATIPEFKLALVDPPFQQKDIVMACIWVVLSLVGFWIQKRMQRGKPPFPPPPSVVVQQGRRHRNMFVGSGYTVNERTPLLVESHIPWTSTGEDNVFESPESDSHSCWNIFVKNSTPSAPPPEPETQP